MSLSSLGFQEGTRAIFICRVLLMPMGANFMAVTPPPNHFSDLYDGPAAYIVDFEGDFESECDPASLDPFHPTEAKPGSEDKVQMLAARYAAGLPLWHDSDCYDHGPDAQNAEDEDELDLMDELEEELA
jgi:hypothetical protein